MNPPNVVGQDRIDGLAARPFSDHRVQLPMQEFAAAFAIRVIHTNQLRDEPTMPAKITKALLEAMTRADLVELAAEWEVSVSADDLKATIVEKLCGAKEGENLMKPSGVGATHNADAGSESDDDDEEYVAAHDGDNEDGTDKLDRPLGTTGEPQWLEGEPLRESECLDVEKWVRNPWKYYNLALEQFGPKSLRASAARNEVRVSFEAIREAVPAIGDPHVRASIAVSLEAAVKRRLKPHIVAAVEKKRRFKDAPKHFRSWFDEYLKEERKAQPSQNSKSGRGNGGGRFRRKHQYYSQDYAQFEQ
eukprot:TRINITY_DN5469_c1_g4_i1.p1 TRINITY_DN5469_c1_g4~~TRINITY_DN5469_c1_g4_i1.p1  ORF type:complete len:304 (-),score=47.08 TRINITY_DN5469_c1_g4_i1:119-1030(-)